ncbi:MAG: hypothetical protein CMH53_01925 [Myxococcales bacterium]|nr:hypothetical protein [Myxococcales bacterium]
MAWKASARRGRLISRVFEQERAQSIYAIVDVGPSMRWGEPGQTALDQAMDLTHSLAEQAALASVPFAMSLTDCDYLVSVAPTVGYGAVQRADRALLDARRAVHESVTPMHEQVLVSKVAAYLQAIEGVDLVGGDTRLSAVMRRQRTVMAALARLPPRERQAITRGPDPSARADLSILRRFCRCRGITLPYRQPMSADARVEGMVSALQQLRRARQGPFFVVLISDYVGFADVCGPLWRALARATHGGHRGLMVALSSASPAAGQGYGHQGVSAETLGALRKSMQIRRTHELARLERAARGVGTHFVGDPSPSKLATAWTQAFQLA